MPESADFVIVGGGTAGCVLASRLTERPDVTVALLEAGPWDARPEIAQPPAFPALFGSEVDWNLSTTAERALGGRTVFHPRGRVVGGSSSINAMIAMRGAPGDYDRWVAEGAVGWGFADVLPAFRRLERHRLGDTSLHGGSGPVPVTAPDSPHPWAEAFVESALTLGHEHNTDFNGQRQLGIGFNDATKADGRRASAATSYLHPALERPGLAVYTSSTATRVVVGGGRAVAVEYVDADGHPARIRADREVILCGGAFHSPQLLMLSGIGPADHLRDVEIAVVVDLPGVGRNLQDHPRIDLGYRVPEAIPVGATSNYFEAGGYLHTGVDEWCTDPDVQLNLAPLTQLNPAFAADPIGFMVLVDMNRPTSRGDLRLASADPTRSPAFTFEYLTRSHDVRTLVEGLRAAAVIGDAMAREIGAERFAPIPSMSTDAELTEYVLAMADCEYHPVGTCRMGHGADAVVNPDLEVKGVEGLRVVDASVMPSLPSGNTYLPVLMIAERAADIIMSEE
ncbi:GMC family oxidoreductase [Pseudonocardia kunmingensis]|uniref:Choline dehydrogenase n=1 Tax=Pseudonocardia kunmingensis TaxID=630975 RepID=A0A543DQ42_9PSEU|nr:GMC family oxidoreductase N-terminal domain-containing protein [Pseudonocardia kunmingensis]TQM11446.1 choline dehydrogenase [Pseudonocardia kunmingensis]